MAISIFSFLPLISAIFVLFLGIFVFLKNKKLKLNIIFFLLSIAMTVWLFSTFMMFVSKTDDQAIFWDRTVYLGVVLIPILMYHFGLAFSKTRNSKILYSGYFLAVTFLILSRTDYFVADLFKYQWGVHTKAQIFHHIFLAYFSIYLFLFYFNLYCHYRKTKIGIERNQTKYIFIAFLILLSGVLGYLPAYGIGIYPFAYLSGLIFTIILAYAILKYRLMDIRMAIKRSTIFSGVVIMITAAYALAAFLLSWVVFGGVYTFKTQIIVGLIVAFLVALGFRPLYDWLRKITDTFLFKGEYKPQELMADISDILSQTLDLDKVVNILKEQISRALRIDKMEVVVLEGGNEIASVAKGDLAMTSQKTLRQAQEIKEPQGVKALRKLINYFKKQREVLVLEELKRKKAEKNGFDKGVLFIRDLEKLKTALAVPLLVKEKLVGLFLLSFKKSGDMFTDEDIKTLEAIAAQAAIALENARLYEEMKDFSKTLQKEVNRQTKNLRDANIRLEQLDKAKSEFISLASHQLRTPLSIIKGYISMMLEGAWGKITGKQKEHLERVYSSNERLIKLVEDLLTVSRIEAGRLEFDFQPLALDELTESMIKEFSQMTAKKGLYLKYIKPAKALPKVKADSLKIRQVIQNLIDNALHYTKEGGATIHLKAEKNNVRFSIEDTGIGISSEEQVTLFEKFSRGKEIARIHTEGTGLGLYLAAKLVEAHQGKIWVESEGKGKGSAFYFELPVKRKK